MSNEERLNGPEFETPRFLAAVHLLERAGAEGFRVGYSEEGEPVVWHACATWPSHKAEAAGALDPVTATLRLCALVIDGGQCRHCGRHTVFASDAEERQAVVDMGEHACIYAYNEQTNEYERSCRANHGQGPKSAFRTRRA